MRKERFYRMVLRLLEAIPLSIRAFLAECIMIAFWAVDANHRRIARINLRIAFPDMGGREISRTTFLCFKRLGTTAAEFVHIPRIDRAYIESHIRIEGAEHLRANPELGALLMTGHFGNWELASHVFGTVVSPVAFIVRPLNDRILDRIVNERRECSGNRAIVKFDSAKEVMRAIRGKTSVGILIDQNVGIRRGILVDLFTKKAYTTDGIARLALALRTNIHPVFLHRDPASKFNHVMRIGPALPADPGAPREEEVLRLTRSCNEELEKAIRRNPEQWFWLHRRWRTRPPGEPKLYGETR